MMNPVLELTPVSSQNKEVVQRFFCVEQNESDFQSPHHAACFSQGSLFLSFSTNVIASLFPHADLSRSRFPFLRRRKDILRDLSEEPVGEVGAIRSESFDETDMSSQVGQHERHVVRLDGASHRKRSRRTKRIVDRVQANQRTTTDLMEPKREISKSLS